MIFSNPVLNFTNCAMEFGKLCSGKRWPWPLSKNKLWQNCSRLHALAVTQPMVSKGKIVFSCRKSSLKHVGTSRPLNAECRQQRKLFFLLVSVIVCRVYAISGSRWSPVSWWRPRKDVNFSREKMPPCTRTLPTSERRHREPATSTHAVSVCCRPRLKWVSWNKTSAAARVNWMWGRSTWKKPARRLPSFTSSTDICSMSWSGYRSEVCYVISY